MRGLVSLALGAFALLLPLPALAADCAAVRASAEASVNGGDLDRMKALHRPAADCDPALGAWLGRRVAAALYNRAIAGSTPDPALLEEALRYGRLWQLSASLGDLAVKRKDYHQAARRYSDALAEIADTELTPVAPDAATILAIRKKAEQANLLSPTYVASLRTRDGSQVGGGAGSVRGIKVKAVALPITFQFDSTDLTPAGHVALADLAGMLASEKPARITIVGHTDTAGADGYNMALSLRRAEAVRTALARRGIASRIDILGKGKTEPYRPDDPGAYSQAERDQMSRRVEILRP